MVWASTQHKALYELIKVMNPNTSKRIALFYPAFLGGGAEAVCLWMLEALKDRYDLTLYTVSEPNLKKLNSMYGTALNHHQVRINTLFPSSLKAVINSLIANNPAIRMALFHAIIRKLKVEISDYELAISTYNAVNFDRIGIQYIHWVRVLEGNPFYEKISGFSKDGVRKNITIANSTFVSDAVHREYQTDSTVIYPPVVLDPVHIPWEDKENAFICSGRLTKAKQPHKVIRILKRVREKGFDIRLYLTGGGGGSYAWGYQNFLQKQIKENSDWVALYKDLTYEDYVKVLIRCRYGIHVKREPFGISIAEMIKAGAIPFVKNKGGQIEIVGGQHSDLMFSDETDAVNKIVQVLSHPEKQQHLLRSLEPQKYQFSTDRFQQQICEVVDQYFATETIC